MASRTCKPSRGVCRVKNLMLDARKRRFKIWRRAREIRELLIAVCGSQRKRHGRGSKRRAAEAGTFVHVMSPEASRSHEQGGCRAGTRADAEECLEKSRAAYATRLRCRYVA